MSRTRKASYRGAAAFDRACRCHGGCPHCKRNRKHNDAVRRAAADEQILDRWADDLAAIEAEVELALWESEAGDE